MGLGNNSSTKRVKRGIDGSQAKLPKQRPLWHRLALLDKVFPEVIEDATLWLRKRTAQPSQGSLGRCHPAIGKRRLPPPVSAHASTATVCAEAEQFGAGARWSPS